MFHVQFKYLPATLLWLACAFSNSVSADSDISLGERLESVDMVSLVRVNRVGNLVNPAMTTRGMMAVEGLRYTAGVLKGWKGVEQEIVTFRVDFSHCVNDLSVGEEYLVFSRQNIDGDLQTFSCGDMIPAAAAQDLVAELNALDHLSVAGTR